MIGAWDLTVTQLITADHAPSKYPPGPSCMNRRAISFCFPWIIFQISWYYLLLHCAEGVKEVSLYLFCLYFCSGPSALSYTHARSESSPGPDIWTWSANPGCIHWRRAHMGTLPKWIKTRYYQDTVVMVLPLASCHSSCLRTAFLNCMPR